jgi:hypothetical protein
MLLSKFLKTLREHQWGAESDADDRQTKKLVNILKTGIKQGIDAGGKKKERNRLCNKILGKAE